MRKNKNAVKLLETLFEVGFCARDIMMKVINKGNHCILKRLLENKNFDAKLNIRNNKILLYAMSLKDRMNCVYVLISSGKIESNDTFLFQAVSCGPTAGLYLNLLLSSTLKFTSDGLSKCLMMCVRSSNQNNRYLWSIKILLSKPGINIDYVDYRKRNMLHFALDTSPEIVKLLLDAGVDCFHPDCDGDSPFKNANQENGICSQIIRNRTAASGLKFLSLPGDIENTILSFFPVEEMMVGLNR